MASTEQVLLRVGMDKTGIESGTRKLLDAQKKAAIEYASFWKRAIEEKEQAETNAAVEGATRRNRARELMRQREVEQARRHARDMAAIEQGYTPEAWRHQQALNSKYGHLEKQSKGQAGAGGAGYAASGELTAGIMEGREAKKLGRDVGVAAVAGGVGAAISAFLTNILEDTFKKMGQMASRFAAMGKGVPLIGTAFAAAMGGSVYLRDQIEKLDVFSSEKSVEENIRQRLNRSLVRLNSKGIIDGQQREDFAKEISQSNLSSLIRIQKELLGLSKEASDNQLRTDILHEQFAKRSIIAERERVSLQQQYNNDRKQFGSLVKAYNRIDNEAPTVEQLAGRDYMNRLNSFFGEGGQMDLNAGNGPFAKAAQDALFFKNKQMADIIAGRAVFDKDGNLMGGDAFQSRAMRIRSENLLRNAGLETPEMRQRDLIDRMSETRDAMQQLVSAAKGEGIKINTGE